MIDSFLENIDHLHDFATDIKYYLSAGDQYKYYSKNKEGCCYDNSDNEEKHCRICRKQCIN